MLHGAAVLLELGGVILGLGILGRLAGRLGLSAIPLYLLAGLAFGEGGLLPLVTASEFIEVGAEVGVILLLLLLGLLLRQLLPAGRQHRRGRVRPRAARGPCCGARR